MPTEIRDSTEEERGLAKKFSQGFTSKLTEELVRLAEDKYSLRYIKKRDNYLKVLMPSGQVLYRDLRERGEQITKSITESGYNGDLTPNGELANALLYSGLLSQELQDKDGIS